MGSEKVRWAVEILEWEISFYAGKRKCSDGQSFFTMGSEKVGWAVDFYDEHLTFPSKRQKRFFEG